MDKVTVALDSAGASYNNCLCFSEDINPVKIPDLTGLAVSVNASPLSTRLVLF